MTLCVAWVRQESDHEELVFATDSRLTGGEIWDYGVKLFDLGRPGCLLCFAGHTRRAYPLILHGVSAIRYQPGLADPRRDIHEVIAAISDVFTEIGKSIFDLPVGIDPHEARAEA